ncbi:scavenger receptor cysteine-rich type 1 protein M130-like [Mya arenaria]|uniref:scavenger receptor cysteine-rich type 1 protein M130-like n=1 Tax=Mya arenaria TaxID=6604 RepID=UPI0022E25487|nr:scavenger receptor cysteine-rich type 1 protein M130-like [Mya arenaria]
MELFLLFSLIFVYIGENADAEIASSKGTDFVISFLQQILPGSTTLQISADVTSRVSIEAPFIGFSKTMQLDPGSREIRMEQTLRETSTLISFKAIRVKSDNPISVYVFDDLKPYIGGYLALPVESLGSEYMVVTKSGRKSEVLISAAEDRTAVSVTLKSKTNITHQGYKYSDGDIIRETLDTFQTWQIQSDSDLSGTIVKADGKVVVIAGSECAGVPDTASECDFITEQLTPVSSWEISFIVPLVRKCANVIRIMARDDATDVKVTYAKQSWNTMLDATIFVDREYHPITDKVPVVVIESKKPVHVMLFTGPSATSQVNTCGPSMTTIPAFTQYSNDYRMLLPDANVDYHLLTLIVPASNLNGLRINNNTISTISSQRIYAGFASEDFFVIEADLAGVSQNVHITQTANVDFGAFVYGMVGNGSFGYPLGLKVDLTKANAEVRLVGGSTGASGRAEVFFHGHWGTVCDVKFDTEDAKVVCKMMGFYFGAANPVAGHYGAGSGIVLVDNLRCTGNEDNVHMCASGQWENSACTHEQDVGVDCSTQVRLVGTHDPRDGRVEVFYRGQWGSVCDDAFDRREATVLCSSLGYGNTGYFYTGGGGSGAQWLDDLECTGRENDIAQCMSKNWGITDCTHEEDVWLSCYPHTPVRLVDGRTPAEGRLEVRMLDGWHSVCDSDFTPRDALVVCGMIGYTYKVSDSNPPVSVYKNAYFGQGHGKVAIAELNCTGSESDIADCASRTWLINSCTHQDDVGVGCDSHIRLVDGPRVTEGRLEVYFRGQWGTICDRQFTSGDAEVVCRQMNYQYFSGYNVVKTGGTYGTSSARTIIGNLSCHGNENDIAICPSDPWLNTSCSHGNAVGVDCGSKLRLVNGSSPTEGRVEVFYGGQWGTVCSNGFDQQDADVICNQMGFNFETPRRVYGHAHYGQGSGQIVIDELGCGGKETDVMFCMSSPWLTHGCTHAQDVGIDCGLRLQDAIQASCTPSKWNISVDMTLLERVFPGSRSSDIVLGQNSQCSGTKQGKLLVFDRGIHTCGTVSTTSAVANVYTAFLLYAYHDVNHPNVVRNVNWTLTLNCNVNVNGQAVIDVSTYHNGSSGSVNPSASFTVMQEFYSGFANGNFTQKLPDHPLRLQIGRDVFVRLYTPNADVNTKMIVQSCYATPTSNKDDTHRLALITNRCSADQSVRQELSTNHEFGFKFTAFSFSGASAELFIHCDVKFCAVTSFTPSCIQVCSSG